MLNVNVVSNIKSASSREGVTHLVYIDSDDGYTELLTEMAYLATKVDKILYINEKPNTFVKYITQLCGGYVVFDDSQYLKGSDIDWLLEDLGSTGLEEKTMTEDLSKVLDVLGTLLSLATNNKGQEIVNLITNTAVQKTLTNSVTSLKDFSELDKANKETLVKTVRGVRSGFTDITKEVDDYRSQLNELRGVYDNKLEEMSKGGVDIYPSYTVSDTGAVVMYVRAYSPCRFLTTFLLSFADYLRNERNKNTKLLMVTSKQIAYTKKYGVFPRISSDNAVMMDMSKANEFVTQEPKKVVWDSFFRQRDVKVFIVLDYTFNERLLSGTNVKTFSAVGSSKDISVFDVKPQITFTSQFSIGRSLALIPIQSYLKMNPHERLKAMMDTHIKLYALLCEMLEV